MPQIPFTRDQDFLIPASLDDWVPADHGVRIVDQWFATRGMEVWREGGGPDPVRRKGEARYSPEMLIRVIIYGTMNGIRSYRDLERACREQLPYRWLSGNLTPDHNTFWRCYDRYRGVFAVLFEASVKWAVTARVLDLRLQAVDGTKLHANASQDAMKTAETLAAIERWTLAAIAELEAQEGEPAEGIRAETGLRTQQERLERVRRAQEVLAADEAKREPRSRQRPLKGNVTDPDARSMKARGVTTPRYNAQAGVMGLTDDPAGTEPPGVRVPLIVAGGVRTRADDHGMLPELIEETLATTGQRPETILADAGYYSGADLVACDDQGVTIVMPEPDNAQTPDGPYGNSAFSYDSASGQMTCPEGHQLTRWKMSASDPVTIRFGMKKHVCDACPMKAACCPTTKRGRIVSRHIHAERQAEHRAFMATEAAETLRRHRSGMIEGVFGIIKARMGVRQLRCRGRARVRAEWNQIKLGFNLRSLVAVAQGRLGTEAAARVRLAIGMAV